MFKLIKILNSPTGIPDYKMVNTEVTEKYYIGCALTLAEGAAVHCASGSTMPQYIAAEQLVSPNGELLRVFPVTPDMVFEVAVTTAPDEIYHGVRVNMAEYIKNVYSLVSGTPAENGIAVVYDTCGAEKKGDKIQIRFVAPPAAASTGSNV